ncbi:type II toxin-antitoxin system Phd/YefM family antitoxin [Pararhizobium sp.]|uniref:type II toxin-antitoxin system Phd/YefM family antitoxin n=1 Tax=Pararhizobium sp. TaxID=1977563 RepID=UPI002723BD1B|nr:type II toxin-antitoxin system Phd/YefM family antitoxin [Pararhizobium sp.]MDO9415453.1 type II toxin-antitoxin system Phd/YefM family antitoxin [Pararhizobium sp.]
MTVVTIHKAKTELSKLIARVEAGEEIILARGDNPVVKLVLIAEPQPVVRGYGSLAHLRDKISDSFFELLPDDDLEGWEGKHSFAGDNGQ